MSKNRKAPSKQKMASIRNAFDAAKLIDVCERVDFSAYAKCYELEPERGRDNRFYYHADNGSDILAVAHLDHVQADPTCQVVDTSAGLLALSGALDDRLGAYVILELLPKLGITCDWLLTTDEEVCASTAEDFVTTNDYNWIIEFDRGGTDVVMYDYETPALVELVEASGARVGHGSFSDICMLEHLGCAAFNWGVGYQDYHSAKSHAWLEDTFRMVARFMKFYEANANTFLRHYPIVEEDYADMDAAMDADVFHDPYLDDPGFHDDPDDDDYVPDPYYPYSAELYEWLRKRAEEEEAV